MNYTWIINFFLPYIKLGVIGLAVLAIVICMILGIVESIKNHKKIWKIEEIQSSFFLTIILILLFFRN